jgi:hypothetical protein
MALPNMLPVGVTPEGTLVYAQREPQPQDDVHDDVSRIGFLLVELSAADRAIVRALVERLAAR